MKPNLPSESVLIEEAMDLLLEHLGALNTERFINSILKDQFDYTEWRRNLWNDKTAEEIHQEASEFFEKRHPRPNNQ
ncbi:MAG: hypothetical protein LBG58_09470 [Planctomycetaceae bacterium]|jgi:hypothetical protein|nr:hypothetical protein [Planctomycetaceae bacterium]